MSYSGASSSPQQQFCPSHPPKIARPNPSSSSISEATSQSTSPKTVYDNIPAKYAGYDALNILRAAASFRQRNGVTACAKSRLPYFLQEVKDFVPKGTTVKNLYLFVVCLRLNFRENPIPGPNCSDFERNIYQLSLKAWGPTRYKIEENFRGFAKRIRMATEKEKDWEAECDGDEEKKIVENCCPYVHLKHALEGFWIAKKYDLNILYMALPKIDTAQAKLLEKQFMKIAVDEVKLKFEKNRLSNHIIEALCIGMKR